MNRDKALSILGLDAAATPSDIKSAYRRLARANHPDKMGSAELFKLVQEAYETLEATVKADTNREAESGRERTAHREARRKAEAERASVERREARRKAAERISKLERKIVEATEAKRKAEEKHSEASEANWEARMEGNNQYDLTDKTMKTLHSAVETEAQLRVELMRERQNIRGNKWMDIAERPDLAREVIAAEWLSMPEYTRKNDWNYSQYVAATAAILGKPFNDNDKHFVINTMHWMLDDGIATAAIQGRIELTDQDFRAGGFFIWGKYLSLSGYYKLSINHYNSALRIKPNVWQIYSERGYANTQLGYYVEAINDFVAGIECVSKPNQSAMRHLKYGIKMAREKANPSPRSS
ncbi:MAG: DnaJ domain-containing protein [Candidatus Poribacteria bacterium]|nr:DnaJ domain-containing protein [Candidatus Poribacteria bacterium]